MHTINVISLNVLDQEGHTFTCQLEVEAEIALDIDIEVGAQYGYAEEEYEPSRRYSVSQTTMEYLYPEVVVRFEPSTGSLEFESIWLGSHTVRISIDEVAEPRSYR